jgi:hypothetical protein
MAWAIATLFSSGACSYYSDDLLAGLAVGDGGAGAASSDPGAGRAGDEVASSAQGGGGSGSTAGSGGSDAGGTSTSAGSAGNPEPAAGAPDTTSAGAGGDGPIDACPDDPNKLVPGQCGCGVPESCIGLKDGLAHRYSFDKPGTVAVDSVGGKNGAIVGASAAMGKVVFDGTAAAYVDLPNGTISALKDASFEIWLTWGGGSIWQRIFDFGTNSKGEGNQGEGTTYLYLSPSDGWSGNALRASFSLAGVGAETVARGSAPLPTGSTQHLVLVVDDSKNQLRLYLNGSVAAVTGFSQSLSGLTDVNNWVGRSNFADAPLKATIEEFRIYKVALTDAQVTASFGFGPNPSFL